MARTGGSRAHIGRMPCPTDACRFSTASPYTPLQQPTGGATNYEASTKVHAIHPSGLPLACNPRMERGPSGVPSIGSGPPEISAPTTFLEKDRVRGAAAPKEKHYKRAKPFLKEFSDASPPTRVVNTGFAPEANPDDASDPKIPLSVKARYFFWLEIGAPQDKSIEETPVDLPPVPAAARLTVALFSFAGELDLETTATVGELIVKSDGTVSVTRQPLAESPPPSTLLKSRLFFPVTTPRQSGSYRLRCHIYWGQILLQSRLIRVLVRQQPRRLSRQPALRSRLDYTLSQTLAPAHLTQLGEHRLSIFMNRNGDGTHSFHFYGTDGQSPFKQDDIRFPEGELHGLINQARGTLRIASWGNDAEWQQGVPYKYKNRQLDLARLQNDLSNMARWGYDFYTKIGDRLAGGVENLEKFEALMVKPGIIQLAMKESPSYVLPAALIYDYPFDTGAAQYSLCQNFISAVQAGKPLEDVECFQGNCPSRADLTTVCPSGFWGFRHYLGMPLSVAKGPDAPPLIPFEGELKTALIVATNLELMTAHVKVLRGLQSKISWEYADQRLQAFEVLKKSPHLVYFYCHGGELRGMPYLQVGTSDLIEGSNLFAYKIRWQTPRPLVFINGCHTTALDPLQALEFISPLVTYSHCAGVIGTEITIFEEMATVFAQECLRLFFAGKPIGAAIRGARLKLLAEGNPLGLVYIPFVLATLALEDKTQKLPGFEIPKTGGSIIDEEDAVIINGIRLPKNKLPGS